MNQMKEKDIFEARLEAIKLNHMIQKDRLTLMVKNDQAIYSYWNLSERKKKMLEFHFRKPLEELNVTMKIVNLTEDGLNEKGKHRRSIMFSIPHLINHLFITDMEANHSYIAEYGVISPNSQKFFSLMQSNRIKTPRNGNKVSGSQLEWSIEKALHSDEIVDHFSTYTYYETSLKNGSVTE